MELFIKQIGADTNLLKWTTVPFLRIIQNFDKTIIFYHSTSIFNSAINKYNEFEELLHTIHTRKIYISFECTKKTEG